MSNEVQSSSTAASASSLRAASVVWLIALALCSQAQANMPVEDNEGRGPEKEAMKDDLSGQWVLVQKNVTVTDVPVVGEIRSTTRSVVLYDLRHEGEHLRGKGKLCEIDIDSGSTMVSTVLPAAFRRALEPPTLNARLKREGAQLRLMQPRTWSVVGARLDDVVKDTLPTSASDPRVFDHDRDGHPGVTVRVEGIVTGDIYVVQRSWSELEGLMRGEEGFKGYVRFGQEQVVLGATKRMLRNPLAARPDLNRSVFQLKRVEEGATCASVRRLAASL